jgi:threonine/homoserine/homoserine lactone efflux protein
VLDVIPFALVVFVGAMSPGPDFTLVTRLAIVGGRRAGVGAAAGIAAGMAVNTAAALAGVGAVIAAAPWLYTTVRLLGAAYLVYLGVTALLSLRRRDGGPAGDDDGPLQARGGQVAAAFRQGLVTNILNPKAIVFLVALMPQFMPPDPAPLERVLLGTVTVGIVLGWFVVVALAVSAMHRLFRRPAARRAVNAVSGTVLVALAVRVALS